MLEKYEWILERYEELSQMIVQPEVLQDPQRYQKALQERSGLQEKVDAYHAYRKLCDQIQDARAMLDDPDLAGIAREELQELTQKKEEAEKPAEDTKPGETVTLVKYHDTGDVDLRRHLLGMGFVRGAQIRVKQVASLGDPIEMSVKGYDICLRKEEAKNIEVE